MSAAAALPWSPERVADLRRLHGESRTMSAIASVLGVTRNAVIGKAHRLGLSCAGRPAPARKAKPPKPAWPPASKREAPKLRPVLVSDDRERLRGLPLFCKATRFNAVAPEPLRVDILSLGPSSCRYLVDPRAYCGHPTGGGSWCPHHARLVYQPARARRVA